MSVLEQPVKAKAATRAMDRLRAVDFNFDFMMLVFISVLVFSDLREWMDAFDEFYPPQHEDFAAGYVPAGDAKNFCWD